MLPPPNPYDEPLDGKAPRPVVDYVLPPSRPPPPVRPILELRFVLEKPDERPELGGRPPIIP